MPLSPIVNPDPQDYLDRIDCTGRFGRAAVSISIICGRGDHHKVMEISDYFGVDMTSLPDYDWDEVEETIKKVIRSSRAGSDRHR